MLLALVLLIRKCSMFDFSLTALTMFILAKYCKEKREYISFMQNQILIFEIDID